MKLDFASPATDGPRRSALEAGQPLRILVLDKAAITRQRVFELPAQMVFHLGNADEETDGTVVLSRVTAPDASFPDNGAVALLAGRPIQISESQLQTLRLDMLGGRVQAQPGLRRRPAGPGLAAVCVALGLSRRLHTGLIGFQAPMKKARQAGLFVAESLEALWALLGDQP